VAALKSNERQTRNAHNNNREDVMQKFATSVAASLLVGALSAGAAQAAEIKVLGGQGSISVIRDLAAGFEKATGHKVVATQERDIAATINSGAPADVATGGPTAIDNLIKSGKVVGTRVDWGRAGIGVAIKAGAPKPDLHDTAAFVRMLRNAKSIGYSSAGSGAMMHDIIIKLGLEEELKAKTKRLDGFPAAEAVARGEVEYAMQQINVILPVAGAELAGPLPPEIQQYNPFAAGVLAVSKEKDVATAMVKFMGDPANVALVRKSGMEPPVR
jgi:molybdate transport system substrate-binding protein